MVKRVVRRSSNADVVEEIGFQGRQDHLDYRHMLAFADIDVHLEPVVEAERYDGVFRTGFA
jgi:hypothetical protein